MREAAPHQERALAALSKWWRSRSERNQHGFLVMPTGSGKTFTAARFVASQVLSPGRGPGLLWVAHNDYLLEQAEEEFDHALREHNLACEVERLHGGGRGADALVALATIQTLERGDALDHLLGGWELGLAVFDEFHHMAGDKWKNVVRRVQKEARVLGLSATPFRKQPGEHKVLRKLFPRRVYGVGTAELIRSRFLARPIMTRIRFTGLPQVSLSDAERRSFAQFHRLPEAVLERVAALAGRDELILRQYLKNRREYGKTVVFCCNVAHAVALASRFQAKGVRATSVYGSAKDDANKTALEEFRTGPLEVVTSVLLLTEGVDMPSCKTAFLARPTESPTLLQQMMGRAMRGPHAGGAETCHVVDFVDNFERGLDFSAGSSAFVRDFDPPVRERLTRRPRAAQEGVDLALILRVHEYLNRRIAEGADDPDRVWTEEILGWIERWDGEMQRALLLPRQAAARLGSALTVVDTRTKGTTPDEAVDIARAIYDEFDLVHDSIPEEDFVGIAVRATPAAGNVTFHPREEIEREPERLQAALSAVQEVRRDVAPIAELSSDLATTIDAIERAMRQFQGARR